jgi:hypothetical protein
MFHPSSGEYSVKSFYIVVNNGGIYHVHTPADWGMSMPPRIHVFLWLLVNNKTLTRDNLHKHRHVDDHSCLFCFEPQTILITYLKCFVPSWIWGENFGIFDVQIGSDFESVEVVG